jgi:hypothetical protein
VVILEEVAVAAVEVEVFEAEAAAVVVEVEVVDSIENLKVHLKVSLVKKNHLSFSL